MFTGIIQHIGEVDGIRKKNGAILWIRATPWEEPFSSGESIAVDGVCLTVVEVEKARLRFDVLEETLTRTSLGNVGTGSLVNLERALRVGDRVGGHLMNGHVDGVGKVASIRPEGRDQRWTVQCAAELRRGIVQKGCIACQGISLTVAALTDESFDICLIPETLRRTSLGTLQTGALLNLEIDLIGKYVQQALD